MSAGTCRAAGEENGGGVERHIPKKGRHHIRSLLRAIERPLQFSLGRKSMHMAEIGAAFFILSSPLNVTASVHSLRDNHAGSPLVITSMLEFRTCATWWLHERVVLPCAGCLQEIATCERPHMVMLLSGLRGKFGPSQEYDKLGQSVTPCDWRAGRRSKRRWWHWG